MRAMSTRNSARRPALSTLHNARSSDHIPVHPRSQSFAFLSISLSLLPLRPPARLLLTPCIPTHICIHLFTVPAYRRGQGAARRSGDGCLPNPGRILPARHDCPGEIGRPRRPPNRRRRCACLTTARTCFETAVSHVESAIRLHRAARVVVGRGF